MGEGSAASGGNTPVSMVTAGSKATSNPLSVALCRDQRGTQARAHSAPAMADRLNQGKPGQEAASTPIFRSQSTPQR